LSGRNEVIVKTFKENKERKKEIEIFSVGICEEMERWKMKKIIGNLKKRPLEMGG